MNVFLKRLLNLFMTLFLLFYKFHARSRIFTSFFVFSLLFLFVLTVVESFGLWSKGNAQCFLLIVPTREHPYKIQKKNCTREVKIHKYQLRKCVAELSCKYTYTSLLTIPSSRSVSTKIAKYMKEDSKSNPQTTNAKINKYENIE